MTDDVPKGVIFFPLKECGFEIQVGETPRIGRCQLTRQPESWAGCGGRICLLVPSLFILESTKNPTCFALGEVSFPITFDSENPTSGDVILRLELSEIYQVIDFVFDP